MTGQPDISFVIPVRDDAERLRQCLASIRAANYPRDRVEVVVVDNGSRDESRDVARQAGALVIDAPGKRVAEMRNLGARASSGRVLGFVDADHVLAKDWIAIAVGAVDVAHRIGAAGSMCLAPANGTWVQRAYDRLRGRRSGRGETNWLGAGNMAVARSAFDDVHGFDTTLETCEDVDLCKRLRAAGYVLLNDDRLVNVHLGDPATLAELFRSELWRGRSNLAVSFRPPVTARELPSAIMPIVHLGGVATAALSPLVGGTAGVATAFVALAPIALTPVARALRMGTRGPESGARQMIGNAAVAFVYEMARALALVAFAHHGVRRR